jgi:hypothetical protein
LTLAVKLEIQTKETEMIWCPLSEKPMSERLFSEKKSAKNIMAKGHFSESTCKQKVNPRKTNWRIDRLAKSKLANVQNSEIYIAKVISANF